MRTCTASGPRGFIPTHVGNTGHWGRYPEGDAVHPHTRGEHWNYLDPARHTLGSSPHTWGTQEIRETPPCAVTVHPHTRGEHRKTRTVIPKLFGSSPHTWGTLRSMIRWPVRDRFIPTHVGNTSSGRPVSRTGTVHPHTRGEHPRSQHRSVNMDGSSPHTWGTLRGDGAGQDGDRFIPTHVGNTMISSRSSPAGPVHPHTRGEHLRRYRAV